MSHLISLVQYSFDNGSSPVYLSEHKPGENEHARVKKLIIDYRSINLEHDVEGYDHLKTMVNFSILPVDMFLEDINMFLDDFIDWLDQKQIKVTSLDSLLKALETLEEEREASA